VPKTYHVQVSGVLGEDDLQRLRKGVTVEGEHLRAKSVDLLRAGDKNCWLTVVLDEGRNRHIRRLLEAEGLETLRLIRVAIGKLELGPLAKGAWRPLTPEEIMRLRQV
jgi:23S rRNA pseudouridine2605 synthase